MIILGWIIASMGVVGTVGAVVMEIIAQEPIYLLVMKLTSGLMGIGGIMLAIKALRK